MAQSDNSYIYEYKELGDDIDDNNIPSRRGGHVEDRNRRQPLHENKQEQFQSNVRDYNGMIDESLRLANDEKQNENDHYNAMVLQLQIVADKRSITAIQFDTNNTQKSKLSPHAPDFIPTPKRPSILDPIREETISNAMSGDIALDDVVDIALENCMKDGILDGNLQLILGGNVLIDWKRENKKNLWDFSKRRQKKLKFMRELKKEFGLLSKHGDSLWRYIYQRMDKYLNENIIDPIVSRWNEICLDFYRNINRQQKAIEIRCNYYIPQIMDTNAPSYYPSKQANEIAVKAVASRRKRVRRKRKKKAKLNTIQSASAHSAVRGANKLNINGDKNHSKTAIAARNAALGISVVCSKKSESVRQTTKLKKVKREIVSAKSKDLMQSGNVVICNDENKALQTKTHCFGSIPEIINPVENAHIAIPKKQSVSVERRRKKSVVIQVNKVNDADSPEIANKVRNKSLKERIILNKAKKKAKYKADSDANPLERGVAICNQQKVVKKVRKTSVNNQIKVRGVVIVRGLPGSGNEEWANTFAERDGNAVIWNDNDANFKQEFKNIFTKTAADQLIILVLHRPLISDYDDFIQYLVKKKVRWRIIEMFWHKSLMDLFRYRSNLKIDDDVCKQWLFNWQIDARSELMYASEYDKFMHCRDDYGSQNFQYMV